MNLRGRQWLVCLSPSCQGRDLFERQIVLSHYLLSLTMTSASLSLPNQSRDENDAPCQFVFTQISADLCEKRKHKSIFAILALTPWFMTQWTQKYCLLDHTWSFSTTDMRSNETPSQHDSECGMVVFLWERLAHSHSLDILRDLLPACQCHQFSRSSWWQVEPQNHWA